MDQRHIGRVARPQASSFRPILGLMFPGPKPVPDAVGAAVKRVPDVPDAT
jgi:hypothetical protein